VKGEQTREKILGIALRLLRTGGYEALNFGTIADELGVTRANIHHHFRNKQNLALEAIGRYNEYLQARFGALREKYPGDFPTAMEKTHEGLWQTLEDTGYEGFCAAASLIAEQSWIPKEVGYVATFHYELLLRIFTELVEESQHAGTVREDRPAEDIAREALSIHLGVAQMAMSLPSERQPGSYSRRQVRDWLTTIAMTPSPAGLGA
jgi:AcrR family transcriptional regulator